MSRRYVRNLVLLLLYVLSDKTLKLYSFTIPT